jgi:hypothetical protein
MKKKVSFEIGALVVLVLIAVIVFYFNGNTVARTAGATALAANYKPMGVENPQIHWDRLTATQETEYGTTGRDIFNWQLPPPPSAPATYVPAPIEDFKLPEPPPPKLALKYFGYGTVPNGSGRRAFLTDGDVVFVVAEGDTVLGRYRIIKITSVNLEFEEIGTGRRASNNIEDKEPAI